MFVFGVLALLAGLLGLLRPELLLSVLGFTVLDRITRVAGDYILVFTIVALTGLAPMRFIAVGAWELTGAIATGVALYSENKK